jgi:hypothetical protein
MAVWRITTSTIGNPHLPAKLKVKICQGKSTKTNLKLSIIPTRKGHIWTCHVREAVSTLEEQIVSSAEGLEEDQVLSHHSTGDQGKHQVRILNSQEEGSRETTKTMRTMVLKHLQMNVKVVLLKITMKVTSSMMAKTMLKVELQTPKRPNFTPQKKSTIPNLKTHLVLKMNVLMMIRMSMMT